MIDIHITLLVVSSKKIYVGYPHNMVHDISKTSNLKRLFGFSQRKPYGNWYAILIFRMLVNSQFAPKSDDCAQLMHLFKKVYSGNTVILSV